MPITIIARFVPQVSRHQDILACGIGTINYGVVLSEPQKAELKKSIGFLAEHAHG